MTPEQANTCIAVMREGKTLRRFTNGGKFGAAIVPLKSSSIIARSIRNGESKPCGSPRPTRKPLML